MLLKKKPSGQYICYPLNNTISFLVIIALLYALLFFVIQTPKAEPGIHSQQTNPTPTLSGRPTLCAPPLNALDRLRNSYIRDRFKRIGHLVCETSNTVKPLYGRPLDRRENKWHYYTSEHIETNLNEIVQLPIIVNNRECMNDWGCNELYDNDVVNVENNSNTFRVKMYKNI